MAKDQHMGQCRVCGLITRLTYEHVPPKAAFNSSSVLKASVQDILDSEEAVDGRLRQTQQRRGAGGFTLCERCNNDTGAWYVKPYVWWAHQGMRFALTGTSSLSLPYHIMPALVAKQIMCMFASACGPELFERNLELRKYVLDRDARGIPPKFRLFVYMMERDSSRSRQTGILAMLRGGTVSSYSEISFPPFGYFLCVESQPPIKDALDITFFTHHGPRDYRDLHLKIPTYPVHGYFPGDTRTRQEWEEAKRLAAHGRASRATGQETS